MSILYIFFTRYLRFVSFDFAESGAKMQVARKQIFVVNSLGEDDLLVVNSATFLIAPFFFSPKFSRSKELYES